MSTNVCSCGGYGCGLCHASPRIYNCGCPDPGMITFGYFLSVRDTEFCPRRLENQNGFLTAEEQSNGAFRLGFSSTPKVALESFSATEDQTFGNFVVVNSDGIWRTLNGPATSGLFLQTNASGQLFLGELPANNVPDPLAVTDLTATNAVVQNLDVTGSVELTGIASGTVTEFLGLNASNQLVTGGIALGIGVTQFFESPSTTSTAYPNENPTAGDYLTIGNRTFDSGLNLVGVTDATTLSVLVSGDYVINWSCEVMNNGASAWRSGAWLAINGIVVSRGSLNDGSNAVRQISTTQKAITISGTYATSLTAGDTLRIQYSPTATASGHVYELQLAAQKLP